MRKYVPCPRPEHVKKPLTFSNREEEGGGGRSGSGDGLEGEEEKKEAEGN